MAESDLEAALCAHLGAASICNGPANLEDMEAAVEAANRAANAASSAIHRSAQAAAAQRVRALLAAIVEAAREQKAFTALETSADGTLTASFRELLEKRIPTAIRLAQEAGACIDDFEIEIREALMQRFANSKCTQYTGCAHFSEWQHWARTDCHLTETFHLARSGLVSYTISAESAGNELGRLEGEGIWKMSENSKKLTIVKLHMQQGLSGIAGDGSNLEFYELPRALHISLPECRRQHLGEQESSDDDGDDESTSGEES